MKFLAGIIICMLLSACSFQDENVEFNPRKGEERMYQIYTASQFSTDTGSAVDTFKTTSNQLLRYKVVEVGEKIKFQVYIDYIEMTSNKGDRLISGGRPDFNPEMHDILSQGFEFKVDVNDGSIKEFGALNKSAWKALLAERGVELEQELKKVFSSSVFLNSIPAKEGAVVTLPSYQSYTNSRLEVIKVTENNILAKIEYEAGQTKVYGRFMLERDRGWLVQMSLVAETPFELYGFKGTVRSNLFIVPQERKLGSLSLLFEIDRYFPPIEYGERPEVVLVDTNDFLTQDSVFSFDEGYFELLSGVLFMNYRHDFSELKEIGDFYLTDISSFSYDGSILPIKIAKLGSYSYIKESGFHHSVEEHLLVGWDKTTKQLDQIAEFRAKAHYRGVKQVKLDLVPDPTRIVAKQYKDLHIELIPVPEKPLSYILKSFGSGKSKLTMRVDGAEGAMVKYNYPSVSVPDWLTSAELNSMMLVSLENYENNILLEFPANPSTLTIYINTLIDSKEFTKEVRFIPIDKYMENMDCPPVDEELLYNSDYYAKFVGYEQLPEPMIPANPILIEPETVAKYGVSLTLTAEQATMCTLDVVDGPEINGHKLRWTNINAMNSHGNDLDKFIRYKLTSADGIRRNFYGIRVSSYLTCAGTPQWQSIAYKPEQSWLIDITQLPSVDTSQSIADFMRRYRFLNAQNLPLAPFMKVRDTDYYQRSLQQALYNGRWLKLAGDAVHIERLVVVDKPIQKEIVSTFPPLP